MTVISPRQQQAVENFAQLMALHVLSREPSKDTLQHQRLRQQSLANLATNPEFADWFWQLMNTVHQHSAFEVPDEMAQALGNLYTMASQTAKQQVTQWATAQVGQA